MILFTSNNSSLTNAQIRLLFTFSRLISPKKTSQQPLVFFPYTPQKDMGFLFLSDQALPSYHASQCSWSAWLRAAVGLRQSSLRGLCRREGFAVRLPGGCGWMGGMFGALRRTSFFWFGIRSRSSVEKGHPKNCPTLFHFLKQSLFFRGDQIFEGLLC